MNVDHLAQNTTICGIHINGNVFIYYSQSPYWSQMQDTLFPN